MSRESPPSGRQSDCACTSVSVRKWKYHIATETIDGALIMIVIAVDTIRKEFEVITRWREL
jgi:hypothetical protein